VDVREVTGEERVEELARMLGGGAGAAMDHARDLLGRFAGVADGSLV
jgi:DNA repair ATPase RecN